MLYAQHKGQALTQQPQSLHMQQAHAAGTCSRHMQQAHAAGTCSWHMQLAHAAGTCSWHMPLMCTDIDTMPQTSRQVVHTAKLSAHKVMMDIRPSQKLVGL